MLHLKQRHVIQSKLLLVYSYQNIAAQGMAHIHTHTHKTSLEVTKVI